MFDLSKAITEWKEKLAKKGVESKAIEELESHLRDHIDQLITDKGLSEYEAYKAASEQLGSPEALAPEFRKLSFISNLTCTDSYVKARKVLASAFVILFIATAIKDVVPEVYEVYVFYPFKEYVEGLGEAAWLGEHTWGLIIVSHVILGILIGVPIIVGVSWIYLKAARKEKVCLGDLFSACRQNYWRTVGAVVLKWLCIIAGSLCLLVPGVYLACRWAFVEYLLIDQKMKAKQAFAQSWAMSKGHVRTMLKMTFVLLLTGFGGLFLLVLPVLLLAHPESPMAWEWLVKINWDPFKNHIGTVAFIIPSMWISAAFAVFYHSLQRKRMNHQVA